MSHPKSFFSVSCAASVLMAFYIAMATFNLYKIMFPISMIDIANESPSNFVKPLWKKKETEMHMRIYLSTKKAFGTTFLAAGLPGNDGEDDRSTVASKDVALLWDEKLSSPSFSKSFLLTTIQCDSAEDCMTDESYKVASSWLDHAEHAAIERGEGGILAAMSAAGHGIESTSILLTLYQTIARTLRRFLSVLSIVDPPPEAEKVSVLERTTIYLPEASPIWSAIVSNTTVYTHVLVIHADSQNDIYWPPANIQEAISVVRQASQSHSLLLGGVNMVKYDEPSHIKKPGRILAYDVLYLLKKFIIGTNESPPWDIANAKPEEYARYKQTLEMKKNGSGYPYWKPEVSIKYINEEQEYPSDVAHLSGMPLVSYPGHPDHPTGAAFMPALYVDEIGMTSEKYIPLNETVTSLPLRISFDRNDMEHHSHGTTATAGAISPARWRLLAHLSEAIEAQKELGFEQSDIDDIRRLIADTNVTLLAITMLASALHLLFEFLTFKSEVSFWRNNKDLTGLSVRSLFLDMIGQTVILLFLIEKDSSLLMTIPSAIGCLIALWKCQRAAGLKFVRVSKDTKAQSAWNALPRLFGYELRATRLEAISSRTSEGNTAQDLTALTIEADRVATRTLGAVLIPLVVAYILYSFVYEEHTGWYSWLITSASSAVYALGFVLMTPQLFLNWKLKSVAHLPWRVLVYKSLNTFIDDLFSFIIRMPTMARISCFRDDIVFFIYLYQRWLYPVDATRPVEGGGEGEQSASNEKKNQ